MSDWRYVRSRFASFVPLIALSLQAGAGAYDTEMARMAKSIAASFDQTQQIKTIAVLDFTDLQGDVTELGKFLAEELSGDFVLGQKQFDVIDRANLKRLLDENKLSRSGLVDPESIKRLGKITGADALVTGTITPLGNVLRVSARVINTESAKIVGAAQGNIDKTAEISELLRARIVASSGTEGDADTLRRKDNAIAPARAAKLTFQNDVFQATVASASFDKSANRITVAVDFTALANRNAENICLAAAGKESMLAVDEFGGQWDVMKIVGIGQGVFGRGSNQMVEVNAREANWAHLRPGASHRFAVVLAPRKADSPLTLNLMLGLYVTQNGYYRRCVDSVAPVAVSVGFDRIVATK